MKANHNSSIDLIELTAVVVNLANWQNESKSQLEQKSSGAGPGCSKSR